MIDIELLKACWKKDRRAQFLLYKESYSLLMSIAFRYKNNKADAEALVNEGFFKILKGLDGFLKKQTPLSKFKPWMSRIMINTTVDEFRKTRKNREMIDQKATDKMEQRVSDYNEIEEQIEAKHLQSMLAKLTDVQRNVFNLFAIDGYNHEEISKMLGIPVGTSRWHLSNARKALTEMLNQFVNANLKKQKV